MANEKFQLLCSKVVYVFVQFMHQSIPNAPLPWLANARPPGRAKLANAPPPGLTRRTNAFQLPGGGGGRAHLELTDALSD